MSEVKVDNVEKWFGAVQVLDGTSFSAQKGAIVALLGASGSGKTTLLRCVAGLEQPQRGRIVIGGRTVFDDAAQVALPPEQRDVGMVFQSYALWPHRTVMENVGYGLKLRRVGKVDIERRVKALLDRMGLGHLADRYPSQLSGGQQQRVAICRALAYEPNVLLLDEPLSNLDAKLREEARHWIRQLILDLEICAILVTHDQHEALAAADDILLLKDGSIIQSGSPQSIYSAPRNFYTASFMGSNNIVPATVLSSEGESLMIGGGGWSMSAVAKEEGIRPGEKVQAVIRVDSLSVVDQASSDTIEMQLDGVTYLGSKWDYRIKRGDFSARANSSRLLDGEICHVRVPKEAVWVFSDRSAAIGN
jgi:iron(III) transport system ATP-binding protein